MASDQMSAAGPICVLGVSDRISGEDQLIFLREHSASASAEKREV
jgi:hypothetical protein